MAETERRYYEAYDQRYRAIHAAGKRWFSDAPSAIVGEILERYALPKDAPMLELGCGEGRDAVPLLSKGYRLLATDISEEAIADCRRRCPELSGCFRVLDCVKGALDERFRFIFAVAVVHMLVDDADRAAFYRFLKRHLAGDGIALVCSMGDGTEERCSDVRTAFTLQEREHEGKRVLVAGTSCQMVTMERMQAEIAGSGLTLLESGHTSVPPDFPEMIYAVVGK